MNRKYLFSSVTRISNLRNAPFQVKKIDKDRWRNGQYIVGEILPSSSPFLLELANGRMIPLSPGDLVIGCLGVRAATLEATGHWEGIQSDGVMSLLTGAGLFGKLYSKAPLMAPLHEACYLGHIHLQGQVLQMGDFVGRMPRLPFRTPTVLIIGTSMSAGKTTTAAILIRRLKKLGLSVLGAKFTGAARYRDTLWLGDAGADHFFDFVEAGLPSTICPVSEYRNSLDQLLTRMASVQCDVAVIELGASPLEPYNGGAAIEALRDLVKLSVLCASDPYAVAGLMAAYETLRLDFISGPATNTEAGQELIHKLVGVPSLNLLEADSLPKLDAILRQHFQPESTA